jgi:hypothetical protein
MTTTASNLIRWSGLSALVAGIAFMAVGVLHPPHVVSSITTDTWAFVHVLTLGVSFFGLLGLTGIYARQAEDTGWLGLAGFLLLGLWLVLLPGFTFFEAFILPMLATDAPTFAESFLGIFTGSAGGTEFGALATGWTLMGVLYLLGGLLFGAATLRAGILPRWAAGVLAFGSALSPALALLPPQVEPLGALPMGLGLAWLGYALWSERRPHATPVARGAASLRLDQSRAA